MPADNNVCFYRIAIYILESVDRSRLNRFPITCNSMKSDCVQTKTGASLFPWRISDFFRRSKRLEGADARPKAYQLATLS